VRAHEKGLELLCEIPAQVPDNLVFDPVRVRQVLLNLVVNARDAMPLGGTLTLGLENRRVTGPLLINGEPVNEGEYVVMTVRDTGDGIPDDIRDRIFDPFFTTKGPGKGTGLGLATCHGIVKQNRGHIQVESQAGQGTTFEVFWPRAEVSQNAPSLSAVPTGGAGSERLLLVEDDDGVREMVARALRQQGYKVYTASDGLQALGHLRIGEPPDLIVTDVIMPNLDGRQLAMAVAERWPDLPVLFTSGHADDALGDRGLLAEGLNFLQKPYSTAALCARIRQMLGPRWRGAGLV
ncbi:MAG: response regulator, partial [Myxococcales bacterium]|nr:response regulator [Myxococcales bacterium]